MFPFIRVEHVSSHDMSAGIPFFYEFTGYFQAVCYEGAEVIARAVALL
jgi:hypothetical protein